MSAAQYDRKFSLIIGKSGGPALDLSALRCTFYVRRGDFQNPNSADIRVYNVSDVTASRLQAEFDSVALQAAYGGGNLAIIFTGTVKQYRVGREDARNTYLDITAADGDAAYNFSTLAQSLAAGAKPQDSVQLFIQNMARLGTAEQIGYQPELPQNGSVRGRVFYGMTRDELRDFAAHHECSWSIQDGKLVLIPLASYIPGEVPLISASTGLIGVPEQTQQGIAMRVLLNPGIRIGQVVKLDNKAIVNRLRYGLDSGSQQQNQNLALSIKTNADGLYYVMTANHTGDTRGNEWYSDLTCLAVDAMVPADLAKQAAILPEAASIKVN